jgi:hypothetical protein
MFAMIRKLSFVSLVLITAVFTTTLLISTLHTAQAASSTTTVLYDGALGGTPDLQNLTFAALDPNNPPFFTAQATQSYSPSLTATILDSTPDINEYAGYTISSSLPITFERSIGFQIELTLRIASETHDSGNDRAGFSVTFLADDTQGIEIAFWEDRIWAQEGGSLPDLFTPAEGVDFDTTAAFANYTLTIITDTYTLLADDIPILTGPVRDYSAWTPPIGVPDVYEQPNLLALSDNTTSAQGETWLAYAAVTTDLLAPPPDPLIDLSPASQTIVETAGTAVFTVTLDSSASQTVTVDVKTVDGTAVAGVDYTAISQTLVFPPAALSQTISVPILDNEMVSQPTREFQIQLTNPVYAQLGNATATASILDDDADYYVYLPMIIR